MTGRPWVFYSNMLVLERLTFLQATGHQVINQKDSLSDINSDILFAWHRFWPSIRHRFWNFIGHRFWPSIRHNLWHSSWHRFGPSISDINSDIDSYILCDIDSDILSDINSDPLSVTNSDILFDIDFDLLSDINSAEIWHRLWHSMSHRLWHSIWQHFWHSICHKFWHSIWHRFWHPIWHKGTLPSCACGWGPVGNTDIGIRRLRSGIEHCHRDPWIEVRWGTLPSGAGSCGGGGDINSNNPI